MPRAANRTLGGVGDDRGVNEDSEPPAARPLPTARLERETTEVEAAVLLVASGRAVSVTVTDLPDANLVIEQLEAWARRLGVLLVRIPAPGGPEAIVVRRHP